MYGGDTGSAGWSMASQDGIGLSRGCADASALSKIAAVCTGFFNGIQAGKGRIDMKLSIISFTNNGLELSKRVSESLMENTGITNGSLYKMFPL